MFTTAELETGASDDPFPTSFSRGSLSRHNQFVGTDMCEKSNKIHWIMDLQAVVHPDLVLDAADMSSVLDVAVHGEIVDI